MTEQLLTPEQVAEITQLNVVTIRRACKARKLKAFKPAGQWRIPRSAVDEWLASTEPEAGVALPARSPRRKHPTSRWEISFDRDAG